MHLLLFVTAVAAVPARTGRFSAVEIPKAGFEQSPAIVSYVRALAKHAEVPVSLRETLISNGHVLATPTANDREYISAVNIGGQTLYLDFDTGSSDTWVFGSSIPDHIRQRRPVYDEGQSQTVRHLHNQSWNINYGDSSTASGHVVLDTVQIGSAVIPGVAIEVADHASLHFKRQPSFSGILGLAWPSINQVTPTKQLSVFFKALDRLQEPVFAAALGHGTPGSWDFGFIDNAKYEGKLHWTKIQRDVGFWQVHSSGIRVNGRKVKNMRSTVIDSGTSLLIMDPVPVDAYYSQVPEAKADARTGIMAFPCNATLPALELDLGGYYASIAPHLMRYVEYVQGRCYGSLQTNYGNRKQIFGDILFKSQYVVHNGKTAQMGFAPQRISA